MKIVLLKHVMLVLHLSAHRAQCLKPLNCRCKHIKTIFPKRYFTFYAMRPLLIYTKTIRLLALVFYER